jgi:hypothetical protein
MSSGGIFKLLANSGVQDKLLMASDYLRFRIRHISTMNKKKLGKYGLSHDLDLNNSWIPDMNMIGKTHVMFVNSSYKPFVATGFEYNKMQASGMVNFGSNVEFSVPTFGDYVNDMVVHVKLSGLKSVSTKDRVRYVSLLGHKLFKQVSFKINNNPLDNYFSDDYNAYLQFNVPPHKRIGWLRNMGQEIPNLAYLTSDPTYDLHRELRWFGDGNQTFKQSHDEVDLWIPLLFWFKDAHSSLPNVAIPYGQTKISIDLADVSELVGFADYGGGGAYINPTIEHMDLYMNNIFMNPEVVNLIMKKFGFSLIRVHGRHNETLRDGSDSVLLNKLKWPTETLYVAFRPTSNATLSQYWHKAAALTAMDVKVPVAAKNVSLTTVGNVSTTIAPTLSTSQLVQTGGPVLSPIDDFYNGYSLTITGGTTFSPTNPVLNRYNISDYVGVTQVFTIEGSWNTGVVPDTSTTYELFTHQVAINVARFYKETPTISTIELRAHGISIFRETDESFYNSYLPYRFGEFTNTPSDRGWYRINFGMNPGEFQPSGHINLSRVRSFYLKYTSKYISSENRVDMIVLADLINFLLIKNGSAVLRYST